MKLWFIIMISNRYVENTNILFSSMRFKCFKLIPIPTPTMAGEWMISYSTNQGIVCV
jgi:hypothetical protein